MNSSVRSGMELLRGSECSGSAWGSRGWCRYAANSSASGGAHSRLSSGRESSSRGVVGGSRAVRGRLATEAVGAALLAASAEKAS